MSRMDFPSTNLVAGTTNHTVGNNTWTWNGYAWTKDCCGYGPTGSTGPAGPAGPTGPTGSAMGPSPYTTVAGALDAVGTGVVKAADSNIQVHKYDRASRDMRHYWDDAGGHGNLFIVDEETPEQYILFNYTSEPEYNGTTFQFNGETRISVGNWNAGSAGTPVRKCRIFYIPNAVTSFNGLRGAVDTTSLDLPVKGLSANAGATFADEVTFLSGLSCNNGITLGGNMYGFPGMRVGLEDGPNWLFDSAGGKIVLSGSEFLDVNQYIRHHNDTDTWIQFPNSNDEIDFRTGGSFGLKLTNDRLHVLRGLSADHGATFDDVINLSSSGVRFSDGTTQTTAASATPSMFGSATFTVHSSSAISTGRKTLSMHRVPYDARITKFEMQASKSGGFTAAVHIAGPDWGNPITGGITGASLALTGLTGYTDSLNHTSITGGNFLYLDVYSNASGATAAQAFLTYRRT